MRGILALAAVLVLALAVFTGVGSAGHGGGHLDICCAWNGQLGDGVLTYKISGGDATAQQTVRQAVEDWERSGISLSEVFGKTPANVAVKFKQGGGMIAGQALRKFDSAGFISSVSLAISGSAFGLPNNQATIAEITRHEMGHALGLGHADFDDLMDPTVGGANAISVCDVAGVRAANHWKLVDGAASPHHPHVSSIDC